MLEYQLVKPSTEIVGVAQHLLQRTQDQIIDPSSIYISTGFGVLISERVHRVFSTLGVKVGEVYDLSPLPKQIRGAETSGVIFCGVSFARLGSFKLLAHAQSPKQLVALTERGIDLIEEQGGVLPTSANISVGFNPTDTRSGPTDSQGYKQSIEDLLTKRGLAYKTSFYFVDPMTPIVQT